MTRRFLICLILATLYPCLAQDKRRGKDDGKPAEFEIVEFHATKTGDTVSLEGRIKNLGERTAYQLKLVFSELNGKGKVVMSRPGMLEENALEAGQEAPFAFEMPLEASAASVRIEVIGMDTRPRITKNGGPHPIE